MEAISFNHLPLTLSLHEVEKYYGLSCSTTSKWLMKPERFPPAKKIGNKWKVNRLELIEWLHKNHPEMTAKA